MKHKKTNQTTDNGQRTTVIHVITGDGKGKTTASLGLALRAIGAGKKVKIIQFMKKPIFSEHKAIKKYNLPIEIECFGIGFYKILGDKHTEDDHRKACQKALASAEKAINANNHDLIILDEINVAIGFGLVEVEDTITVLKNAKKGDIVLTGRNAHAKIKKIADLISDVKKIKHYFDAGQNARKGIEY